MHRAARNAQVLSDGRKRGQGDVHGAPRVTDQRFVFDYALVCFSLLFWVRGGTDTYSKRGLCAEEFLRWFWVAFNVGVSVLL